MNNLKYIEDQYTSSKEIPKFKAGDRVKVHVRIKEGEKERIQIFEGTVIKFRKGGVRSSFTVRKVSYGVGVERIFPLYSPVIDQIEVVQEGRVRRAKLYYLRNLRGRQARIQALDKDNKVVPNEVEEEVIQKQEKIEKVKEAKTTAEDLENVVEEKKKETKE